MKISSWQYVASSGDEIGVCSRDEPWRSMYSLALVLAGE